MKTEWDYSNLAEAYLKRPSYSGKAINQIFEITGCKSGSSVCDIGAGVAHLTIELIKLDLNVTAVEPNDAMRKLGIERTSLMKNVVWFEGTGEITGQKDSAFDLVTFGSSFNVTDRQKTLKETKRILKNKGWMVAMWNHRNLEDPIQRQIEDIIKRKVSSYSYGVRREDQSEIINASGFFKKAIKVEGEIVHHQNVNDIIEAWRSHATLQRQSGSEFHSVISDIEDMLKGVGQKEITVPYTTRAWLAQLI